MRRKLRLQLLATAITVSLINGVDLGVSTLNLGAPLNPGDQAYARSTGGRSGGGSFRSSPSSSRSSSSPSRSSRSSGSNYSSPARYRSGYIYHNSYRSSAVATPLGLVGSIVLSIVIVLVFVAVAIVLFSLTRKSKQVNGNPSRTASGNSELDNDIVTVSKLQVALLAESRSIQAQLTQISLSADTSTQSGLTQLLQESALALLRSPENWTHVLASSQAAHRQQAEQIFNRFSIEERSKLSVETLVNVGGKTRKQPIPIDSNQDPTAYIVVTLLIGTEDDKRLFNEIWSREELEQALERTAAVPCNYLLTFELLWSPQAEMDSLTHDELLSEYTAMLQI